MRFQRVYGLDKPQASGTFHLWNVDMRNVESCVRDVLRQYSASCAELSLPYFFAFEFTTLYAKTAWISAQMVVNVIEEEVEENQLDYTLDWYSVEQRFYQQDVLLTFAIRPCDLRELVADV